MTEKGEVGQGTQNQMAKSKRRQSLVEKSKHAHTESVHALDFTGLPSKDGYLRKENRHGRWQKRYFVVNNCYLNYYNKKSHFKRGDSSDLSASIDLRNTSHICVLARSGVAGCKIAIQTVTSLSSMAHHEEIYFLRASSPVEAASWAATLNARRAFFLGVDKFDENECDVNPPDQSVEGNSVVSSEGQRSPSTNTLHSESNSSDAEEWWDEASKDSDDEGFITGDEGSTDSEGEDEDEMSGVGRRPTRRDPSPVESEMLSSPVANIPAPFVARESWKQPDVHKLMVRGPTYLRDGKKQKADDPVFRLIAVDNFLTEGRVDHIANVGSNRVAQAIRRGDKLPFLFVVNFQVPGPPFYSFVLYFAATDRMMSTLFDNIPKDGFAEASMQASTGKEKSFPRGFRDLARKFFLGSDDSFRDSRFKLIPRIGEGPFIVRKSVGSKPAIIGKKLKQRYFLHPNYMELDIDIGASVVAWKLTQLSLGYAKILQVDLAMVLQGNEEEELPEQVLGIFRAIHPDFSKAEPLGNGV